MDYQKEMCNIRERRKMRSQKKIFIRALLIIVLIVIMIFIFVLCMKSINNKASNNQKNIEIIETVSSTLIPCLTQEPTTDITSKLIEKPTANRGVWEPIPDNIKEIMKDHSLPQNASVTFDNLAYLTIPHYDFNYNITEGHLVVNVNLADEVLDIFSELFDIKYPIERMQLVDYYNADDYLSIEHNNTSAFNYRESTDGTGRLSAHALGCAIDINPQINPYVNSNGIGSHQNASEYWSRNISVWHSDIAKEAYIGTDSEIYKIFVNKYGWEWGGSWSSYRDYQHFQKNI